MAAEDPRTSNPMESRFWRSCSTASGATDCTSLMNPILLAYPKATIYEFSETGLRPVEYTDTEHYVVTRAFLGDPSRMLRELFRNDDTPPNP
jgi:hypothetical protein